MKRDKFLLKIKETFWFLPAMYSLAAIVVISLLTFLEAWWVTAQFINKVPEMFTVSVSTARSLYAALVTAILTMTAISFSNIMVILRAYSSQFSPRTLQEFIHSKITRHTLGIFTFGFLVVLLNLWFLNGQSREIFLSAFFTIITAIVSLFAFIFFIHHSSRWLQANFLLGILKTDGSEIIDRVFKQKNYGEHENWNSIELMALQPEKASTIYAQKAGYIQAFEIETLVAWAKEKDIVIESQFMLGEYVHKGMPLFRCWNLDEEKPERQIEGWLLLLSNERTDLQDIEFSIQKIVEIALKGVSPSINDPQTTINAVQRIGELLIELGQRYRPVYYYTDETDELRLILKQRTFHDYLYKSFYQIRHYAKNDISVMFHIFQVLYHLAYLCDSDFKTEIWRFTLYMVEAIDVERLSELDYQYIKKPVEQIASLYDEKLPF